MRPDEWNRIPADHPAPMEDDGTLKDVSVRLLVRLVIAISRACIQHGTRQMSRFGLSMSQSMVLGALFARNGCRQEELRSFVALDKGNVTRALQRLEESGLVERRTDPADRRVVRVYSTDRARSVENEMFAHATLWDKLLTAGFTPEEHEILVDLLLRVEVNAQAMVRAPATDDPS